MAILSKGWGINIASYTGQFNTIKPVTQHAHMFTTHHMQATAYNLYTNKTLVQCYRNI